jgi:hypothetical protein
VTEALNELLDASTGVREQAPRGRRRAEAKQEPNE